MKNNGKKLLMIQTVRVGANGITSFVLNYYRHLDYGRFSVDFVFPNEPSERLRREIASHGGCIYVLPMRNRNPILYFFRLSRIVRENGYDIVHAHGNSATLWLEMAAAKRGGARVRIPHSHNTTCRMMWAHRLLKKPFERAYTDALACGQEAGEWLFPKKPFRIMFNAIDTKRFAFSEDDRTRIRREFGLENSFVVVHVGTYNAQKNHAGLIEIFDELHRRDPSARLMLIGEGDGMDETELNIYRRGLSDAVRLVGAVPDTGMYLSAADAFVLPSLYEGLPFTLIEAQCAGLPCYVSDTVTRSAVFVEDAVTSLPIAGEGYAAKWADAIGRGRMQTNRPVASQTAARAIAGRGYDIRRNANALMRFYESCGTLRRLAVVTHKMTGGGTERVISEIVNDFSARGIECTLVSECNVASFYPLHPAVGTRYLLNKERMGALDVPKAYRRLKKLVRELRPDAVLALPEKVNVWTVLYLRSSGVPVIVSERNDPHRHPESKLKRILRTLIYPRARGFIFQTEEARDFFSEPIRERGIVLDNPLELSTLPDVFTGEREKTVVGAGRLTAQKNFPMLIRAFSRFYPAHNDWTLVIYGEGEERAALEALAEQQLPAGTVLFPGQAKNLPERLLGSGMFVLPSSFEGMPNALIEAMAVGCPSIATDCASGGPRSVVKNGMNGILIPVGDENALVAAMERIADDPAFADRLTGYAPLVRARYDRENVLEQWRGYIDRIVRE